MSCGPASAAPGAPVTDRPGTGLEVGRLPDGATWVIFRYPEHWDAPADPEPGALPPMPRATYSGTVYDAARNCVELSPATPTIVLGSDGLPRDRHLPNEVVVGPDGTRYRADPARNRVLERRPGTTAETPLPCLSGPGRAAGQLRRPGGLAIDARGNLLVADAGNHRVVVVRLGDAGRDRGSVATHLGAVDGYGRPRAGTDGGAMREPLDVAVDARDGTIYVADRRGGRIHVFDAGYRWCRSFAPNPAVPRPAGGFPWPVAVDVRADGTLLVADTTWGRLLHLSPTGVPLGEVPSHAVGGRFKGIPLSGAVVAEGSVVIGPLDSGLHDVAWHEVHTEVELPRGTTVDVQTWASNDETAAGPSGGETWGPAAPVPLGTLPDERGRGEHARLVLSCAAPHAREGTDRGRYLWVRLTLRTGTGPVGSPTAPGGTPSVYAVRATFPRPSMLAWLPAHWARRDDADPAGALFVERYLALFESVLNRVEVRYEDLGRLLTPSTAPPEWLAWIATWLDLAFDASWPTERRRGLVREAMTLYRRRGTVTGLNRFLEIYLGTRPVLTERFTQRGRPLPADLGAGLPLGTTALSPPPEPVDPDDGAHAFDVYVPVDPGEDADALGAAVRRIVDVERPAHTVAAIHLVRPDARVGLQSAVGLDLVLGHGEDPRFTLPAPTDWWRAALSPAEPAPRLDEAGIPLDDSVPLT